MIIRSGINVILIAAIAIIFSGCKNHSEKITEQPPVKVKVDIIDKSNAGNSDSFVTYSGTVSSSDNTLVSFSVAGTIMSLTVEEGSNVAKGQLLGTVSSGDYRNANNIAEAQLEEAKDAYNRLKKLHDANALPDIKWVEIQQKLKEAENQVQITRRTVSESSLYSPVSGTVSKKLSGVGQNVAPGQPVYELVSTGNLTIDISVPENEIGNFSVGQKAVVGFENKEIGEIEGIVKQKSVVADPLTRGFTVKLSIPSVNNRVLPGMVGSVKFAKNFNKTADEITNIILPPQAVQLDFNNRNFVWYVKNGKAERKFVKVDELMNDGVMILEGLSSGDTVITQGMHKVGTGTKVEPIFEN